MTANTTCGISVGNGVEVLVGVASGVGVAGDGVLVAAGGRVGKLVGSGGGVAGWQADAKTSTKSNIHPSVILFIFLLQGCEAELILLWFAILIEWQVSGRLDLPIHPGECG